MKYFNKPLFVLFILLFAMPADAQYSQKAFLATVNYMGPDVMYRNYYKKLSATARAKLEKAKPGLTTEMHFLRCMGHQFFIIRYKGLNCFQLLNSYAQVLHANMLKARTGGAAPAVPANQRPAAITQQLCAAGLLDAKACKKVLAGGGQPKAGTAWTDKDFANFLENYQNLGADEIYDVLYRKMNQTSRLLLRVYSAFEQHLHEIICTGKYADSLIFNGQNCPQIVMQQLMGMKLQLDLARMNPGAPYKPYWEDQRKTMLIAKGCSSGKYDTQSCSAFMGGMQTYGKVSGKIGESINEIGKPVPCTHTYDETSGRYLGCRPQ